MTTATNSRARTAVASSLAFVIGGTIMILLHETAHAVAAMAQGHRAIQLPFAVMAEPPQPVTGEVITLLASPVFSLAFGIVGVIVDRAVKPFRNRAFWCMVWLWTIFASLQEAFGYLQISAFIPAGDTAQAYALLGAPPVVYIVSTIVGFGCMVLTASLFSGPISELSSSKADKYALAFVPWIAGSVAMMLLTLVYITFSPNVPTGAIVAILAACVALGVYAPMSFMFNSKRFDASAPPAMPRIPVGGIVLLVALVAFNLVLTREWIWP